MEVIMADKTKQAKEDAKRVSVKLPRNAGQNANQDEFFSVNFKNYIIKRGERVEIPEALAEVIENNEKSEEFAMKYAEEKGFREAQ
jgi:hypothetical protein